MSKSIEKESIPNSLIIQIKTNIPNFYKVNYEPYMTIPGVKSKTIHFNPLIKYNKTEINNIPKYTSENIKYTQFFYSNEFDNLLNRILSNFLTMQKKISLTKATEDKIVENNIELTLNTLFPKDGIIYLNKKPYTIIDRHWNKDEWQIDTKPIDKLITPYSYITGNELQNAEKELQNIPENIRQGNLASSELKNENIIDSLKNEISNIKLEIDEKPLIENKELLKNIDKKNQELLSNFISQNDPITKDISIINDPLVLSLFISENDFMNYIKNNSDKTLLDLYNNYITLKNTLHDNYNRFNDKHIEILEHISNLYKYGRTLFQEEKESYSEEEEEPYSEEEEEPYSEEEEEEEPYSEEEEEEPYSEGKNHI
jgi:hypothetical protein